MSLEMEAKMKVPDLESVAKTLRDNGAQRRGADMETNIFFDAPDATLRKSDCGLRLRIAEDETGKKRFTVTLKGPAQKGQLKTREETEFSVDNAQAVEDLFASLGYRRTISFQKRRQSWLFADCKVELDELPYLGKFVEIEGDSEPQVLAARKTLGLAAEPLIATGYIAMLSRYLQEHNIAERDIRL
jgi:adenylate cyclase class 2